MLISWVRWKYCGKWCYVGSSIWLQISRLNGRLWRLCEALFSLNFLFPRFREPQDYVPVLASEEERFRARVREYESYHGLYARWSLQCEIYTHYHSWGVYCVRSRSSVSSRIWKHLIYTSLPDSMMWVGRGSDIEWNPGYNFKNMTKLPTASIMYENLCQEIESSGKRLRAPT